MPLDRVKIVHNSRKIIFGYITNDDDEERTARNEADDLLLINHCLLQQRGKGRAGTGTSKTNTVSGTPSTATATSMAGNKQESKAHQIRQ